jgi:hypothetical protein
MATLRDYIKQFNEGEIEIVKLFGGRENFLRVVEMKGMMNLIDPKQLEPTEQNYLILYFLNNDIEKFNYWVQEFLGDVTVVDGEYYLTTTESVGEVLGSLTCDNNRNSMDGKLVEEIIDGEHTWDFDDTTDDVYRDVVEDLNEKNTDVLVKSLYEILKDEEIKVDEDLDELTDEETIKLTEEQIRNVVLKDRTTFYYVVDNYASDIKDNLYYIHRYAYETAYGDEVYEDIWSAFDEIFEGKPNYKTIQHPRAQNKEVEQLNLKLVDFKSKIENFLEQYKGYNSGTLEYQGSYTAIINELEDCVAVYGPDYADWTKTKKYINEYFLDWWEY